MSSYVQLLIQSETGGILNYLTVCIIYTLLHNVVWLPVTLESAFSTSNIAMLFLMFESLSSQWFRKNVLMRSVLYLQEN